MSKSESNLRVALVHDDITQYGGAERLLRSIHEIWPEAPIFTTLYDGEPLKKKGWSDEGMDIRPGHFQWLPNKSKWANKFYLPIYPLAVESLDLNGYDIVISSTTRYAHGVITRPETCHISYCNSPARFLWSYPEYEKEHGGIGSLQKALLAPILHYQRMWDRCAALRPDYFIANSTTAKSRVSKIFRRESVVIHPPVSVEKFFPVEPVEKENYYIIVSRLAGHKRFDIAVKAFNLLGSDYKLVIIGDGDKKEELEKMSTAGNVEFKGFLPDKERAEFVQKARAFIYTQLEDFGITAVEANAAGTPVIAFRGGGVLDTMIENETALMFDEQTPESLAAAIRKFEKNEFSAEKCIENSKRFSDERFKSELRNFVMKSYEEYVMSFPKL